ncbi:MAG: ribosome assembly cofactor RimP [Bacteroidetes bacterium HGW-Bacteroidetes-13]|jgi:ribosome maturation factor RimP|nr:MAG: ribosome assembly cofactor RimP [Bacteroidetes bacterium HGW-Bacteroidetes-13]
MLAKRVKELLDDFFEENPSLFLIDLQVSEAGQIVVIMDGDEGITVQDCVNASRKVEHNLDPEEDFSIEVTSAGVSSPLVNIRQYRKNIGREIEVFMANGRKNSGQLIQIQEEEIVLLQKIREPKPIGKGKITVEKKLTIPFTEINKTIVTLKFN